MTRHCGLLRQVIWTLAVISVLALLGGLVLSALGREAPPELWMVVIGTATTLGHLLSTPQDQNRGPVDVQVKNQANDPVPVHEE